MVISALCFRRTSQDVAEPRLKMEGNPRSENQGQTILNMLHVVDLNLSLT